MSSFSIKKLEPSEPLNLYADLNQSIEFGEGFATSVLEHEEYGKIYYLGGLEVYNLNSANLSEETIARLYNALESGNIYYAVFPDDQRKGRLPLVLNEKTRAFLRTLPELLHNKAVKWYLYQLPGDIDPDNNEKRGSDFVTDKDGNELELTFEDLEKQITDYGFVKEQEEDEAVFESEEESNDNDKSNNRSNDGETETNTEEKVQKTTNDLKPKMPHDESDDFEKTMFEDDEFENPEDTDNEDAEYDKVFSQTNNTKTQTNDVRDSSDEVNFLEETEQKNNDENVSELTLISNRTKKYIKIPKMVEDIIENITLPKFSEYPDNNVYTVTSNTMKKEINDCNEHINELEQSIKREAVQQYRDYMYQAYLSITKELNTETGNDIVKSTYLKCLNTKTELENQFDQDVIDKKAELEDIFYGQAYENYKAEVKAQIKKWYEDKYYEKNVTKPLDDYTNKRKEVYEDRKLERTADFNDWLKTIEDVAIGQDQQKAIKKTTEFIQHKVNEAMGNIEVLQKRMDQVNQSLAQLEYQERANEHIRKNFGTNIEQDEQAKIYQQKLKTAIEEKAELDAAFKKFEAKANAQQKSMQESYKKELEEINENHNKLIEELKNEKEAIEKDNRDKEALVNNARRNTASHAKKTGVKFAGIASVVTAIVVGGCSMITNHSSVADNNSKIEQQKKEIRKTNEKIKKQEDSLESKNKEIESQKEEIKKAQDEAKKAKDEKSKKDK
ncbi:hypothetical protein F6Q80_00070 [Staphylococcus aureus]|uniref:hypothetical protein n=1 Tax=Staphylococcus aureus TaxID=1280 RepID=UPI0018C46E99|nr:hypothetical protein [Staphylococcus aureus]